MPKYPEIQFKHILEANALFRLCLYDAKWKAAVKKKKKNQSIWSAAGWTKDHIVLSLTSPDACMRPVSWIKINFPSIENDPHHSRRTFLPDQQPGSLTVLTGPALSWLMNSVFSNPRTVILSSVGKSQAPNSHLAEGISKTPGGRDIFMPHLPPTSKFWEVVPLLRFKIFHLELALRWKLSHGCVSFSSLWGILGHSQHT